MRVKRWGEVRQGEGAQNQRSRSHAGSDGDIQPHRRRRQVMPEKKRRKRDMPILRHQEGCLAILGSSIESRTGNVKPLSEKGWEEGSVSTGRRLSPAGGRLRIHNHAPERFALGGLLYKAPSLGSALIKPPAAKPPFLLWLRCIKENAILMVRCTTFAALFFMRLAILKKNQLFADGILMRADSRRRRPPTKKALTVIHRKGFNFMEPLSRIELETSSLPRMRSTN